MEEYFNNITQELDKYYVVKMENGEDWGVPADIIARNRADYYGKDDLIEWNEEYNAMMKWFDTNDYEFADWAKNNMDWSDVKDYAILLSQRPVNSSWQEAWINGDYEYKTIN